MNNISKRNIERNKIQQLARHYKNRGYRVFAELPGYDLPHNYADIRPDLVVEKDDETILIEVKTSLSKEKYKDDIRQLAEYAQKEPKIRFDLVLTNPISFQRLRDKVKDELIKAHSHYHIWKQLWPTEEFIRVINKYRVFFQNTRVSHLMMFFAAIERITNHNRYSLTIWRLLDEVEGDINLVKRLSLKDIQDCRAKLEKYTNILERIYIYQRRNIYDEKQQGVSSEDRILEDKVITVGEAESLLKDMGEIFNKISGAYDGQFWKLTPLGIDDTTSLLKDLNRLISKK